MILHFHRAFRTLGTKVTAANGSVFEHVGLEHQVAAQQRIVARRREIPIRDFAVGRWEAVRGAEGRVRHAELARLGIHQFDKGGDGAGGKTSERASGIVGRLDHHRVDQLFDGKRLARVEVNLGAADIVLIDDADRRAERQAAGGQLVVQHSESHEFHHARGRAGVVGAIFEQDFAGARVDHDGALEGRGIVGRGGAGGGFPSGGGEERGGQCDGWRRGAGGAKESCARAREFRGARRAEYAVRRISDVRSGGRI